MTTNEEMLERDEAIKHLKEFVRITSLIVAIINLQPKENILGPEINIPFIETGTYKSIISRLKNMERLLGLELR